MHESGDTRRSKEGVEKEEEEEKKEQKKKEERRRRAVGGASFRCPGWVPVLF
jgi:hypothetical protein